MIKAVGHWVRSRKLYHDVCRTFYRIVPHTHSGYGMMTKYGMSVWCNKCGCDATIIDRYLFGD